MLLLTRLAAGAFVGAVLLSTPSAVRAQQPCMDEFAKHRQEVDQRFDEARAAGQRKAPQREVCQVLRRATDSLARFAKYVEDNQAWCQFPPQIIEQVRSGLQSVQGQRNQVCAARPVAGPAQAPPSGKGIGALGSPTGLGGAGSTPTNPTTQGAGVFGTLGGASR